MSLHGEETQNGDRTEYKVWGDQEILREKRIPHSIIF